MAPQPGGRGLQAQGRELPQSAPRTGFIGAGKLGPAPGPMPDYAAFTTAAPLNLCTLLPRPRKHCGNVPHDRGRSASGGPGWKQQGWSLSGSGPRVQRISERYVAPALGL